LHRECKEEAVMLLKSEVKQIFEESGGSYGPGRICGVLRLAGHKASYRKIGRYMSEMKLNSVHNRHRQKNRSLTDSRCSRGEGYPNLLIGQTFDKPGRVLSSDITYLKSSEG
jgi:putative transposase